MIMFWRMRIYCFVLNVCPWFWLSLSKNLSPKFISGILNPKAVNVIGNGVVLNPPSIIKELTQFSDLEGRLLISEKAQLNLPYHSLIDLAREKLKGSNAIGTTGKGIGPAYSDKINRIGHRAGELLNPAKLYESILEYFAQNKIIFDALDIVLPSNEELKGQLEEYSRELSPFIVNTTKKKTVKNVNV